MHFTLILEDMYVIINTLNELISFFGYEFVNFI